MVSHELPVHDEYVVSESGMGEVELAERARLEVSERLPQHRPRHVGQRDGEDPARRSSEDPHRSRQSRRSVERLSFSNFEACKKFEFTRDLNTLRMPLLYNKQKRSFNIQSVLRQLNNHISASSLKEDYREWACRPRRRLDCPSRSRSVRSPSVPPPRPEPERALKQTTC